MFSEYFKRITLSSVRHFGTGLLLFTLTATPAGWAAILSHIALTALFAIVGAVLEEVIRRLKTSDVVKNHLGVLLKLALFFAELLLLLIG